MPAPSENPRAVPTSPAAAPAVHTSGATPAFLNAWSPPDLMGGQPVTTGAVAPVVVVLTLDTGQVVTVEGDGVLLGRAPARAADDPAMAEVAVADPSLSISKTHLAMLRRGDALFVVDRWSTNGSSLVRDGVQIALVGGQETLALNGDKVTFGDRVAHIQIG